MRTDVIFSKYIALIDILLWRVKTEMLKIIVVAILTGAWILHIVCAGDLNKYCIMMHELSKEEGYFVREFRVNPSLNISNVKSEFKGGKHVKCLELKLVDFDRRSSCCIGCCDVSANKDFHEFRDRMELDYICDSNPCCRDEDIKKIEFKSGCELFRKF